MSLIRIMGGVKTPANYSLSDLVYYNQVSIAANVTNGHDISFSSDGTKMYLSDNTTTIKQYSLSTAWNVTTATYAKSFTLPYASMSHAFSPDGTKMYVSTYQSGTDTGTIRQYDLSTAWDIATAVAGITKSYSAQYSGSLYSIAFASDGTKMYISGNLNLHQYNMSTAWYIASSTFSYTNGAINSSEFEFSNDGKYCYFIESPNVKRYLLGTAWSVSTMGTVAIESSSSLQVTTNTKGLFWGNSGATFYIIDGGSTVKQFNIA